ncbi:MAG: FtsX-like permease family protein [Bacteroidia bacterium]|nr:FtsX-like permease family protein [Bacteroidia bacterium]
MFLIFSFVTILIACIGLLGLVSFMVTSRTKEIGIRKVLGADVFTITTLLSREFILLVLLANAIACPLAWYGADLWLREFAFHTRVGPGVFVFTGALALLVTLCTVGYQTLRAAGSDPVKSLRYE